MFFPNFADVKIVYKQCMSVLLTSKQYNSLKNFINMVM